MCAGMRPKLLFSATHRSARETIRDNDDDEVWNGMDPRVHLCHEPRVDVTPGRLEPKGRIGRQLSPTAYFR